ncbi:MAG: hypothetical protein ABEJ02_01050 [Candidatus Paceibacteria bacterium]
MLKDLKHSLKLLTFLIAAILLLPNIASAEETDYSHFVQSELSEAQTLDLGEKATKLEKGDFDDDGRNDFVILGEDGTLSLSSNKSGGLGTLETIIDDKSVTDFTIADVNNDLVKDIVFTAGNQVYKLESTPGQADVFRRQPTRIFTADSKLNIIRSGDIEIDKRAEFAVASSNKVHIIESDGVESDTFQIGGNIKEVLFLDYDDNLRLDLVVHSANPSKVSYLKGVKDNKYQPDFSKEFKANELNKIEKIDDMIFFDRANSENFTYGTSHVVGENVDRIEVNTTTTNYPLGSPQEVKWLNFDRFARLSSIMSSDQQREEAIFLNRSGSAIYKTVPFSGYKKDLAKTRIYQDKMRNFTDFAVSDIDSNKTRDIVLVDNQNMELVLLKNKDRICSFKKDPLCVSVDGNKGSERNMCIAEKLVEMIDKLRKNKGKQADNKLNKVKDKVCSGDEGDFKAGTECMKYKPVCGEDGVTYYNKCWAETFDKDYYLGKCETMKVNKSVCKLKKKEFTKQIKAVERMVSQGKSKKQLEQSPSLNFVPKQSYFSSYLSQLLPMCEQKFGQISNQSNDDQTSPSNRGSNLSQSSSESCPLDTGQPYKRKGSSAVYLVTEDTKATPDTDESCRIMPIKRAEIYFEYFDSWDPVQTITKSRLDQVDSFGFAPRGPKADIKMQSLITTPFTSEVYLLMQKGMYRFNSLQALKNQGFEPSDIIDIHPKLMSQLKSDNQIKVLLESNQDIISGLIYKKKGSSAVYLKQDLGKRRFSSFRELKQFAAENNYKLRNIAQLN